MQYASAYKKTLLVLVAASMGVIRPYRTYAKDSLEVEGIAGLYYEEMPLVSTFYESFVPLVYQLQVPKWDRGLLGDLDCLSKNRDKVMTHLCDIRQRLTDFIYEAQPLANLFSFGEANPEQSPISFECDVLAKHFSDLYLDGGIMAKYLEKLQKCSPLGDTEFFSRIANYDYNISDVYSKLINDLGGFGGQGEGASNRSSGGFDGLRSNMSYLVYSAVQSAAFVNFYIEANRWKSALQDCESGRIPSTILPPSLIADGLQDLLDNLANSSSLIPAIISTEMGNYYKQNEITDCSFSDEGKILVRILVPVITATQSYSIYRIQPATFTSSLGDSLCQIQLPRGQGSSSNYCYVLVDNMNKIAYETRCDPHSRSLCHVPKIKALRKVNPCISSLINKDVLGLVKYCRMTCDPVSPYHFSGIDGDTRFLVSPVGSDKFIINSVDPKVKTSTPSNDLVTLQCPGDYNRTSVPCKGFGAVEVTLPCECIIVNGKSEDIFKAIRPCIKGESRVRPKIINVVPYNWLREGYLLDLKTRIKGVSSGGGKIRGRKLTLTDILIPEDNTVELINMRNRDSGMSLLGVFSFILTVGLIGTISWVIYNLHKAGIDCNPLRALQNPGRGREVPYSNIGENSGGTIRDHQGPRSGSSDICPFVQNADN